MFVAKDGLELLLLQPLAPRIRGAHEHLAQVSSVTQGGRLYSNSSFLAGLTTDKCSCGAALGGGEVPGSESRAALCGRVW